MQFGYSWALSPLKESFRKPLRHKGSEFPQKRPINVDRYFRHDRLEDIITSTHPAPHASTLLNCCVLYSALFSQSNNCSDFGHTS